MKLIVLIEHGPKVKTIQDVLSWKSRYTKMDGRRLYQEMERVSYAYGVKFEFCDKHHTGQRIKELLDDG